MRHFFFPHIFAKVSKCTVSTLSFFFLIVWMKSLTLPIFECIFLLHLDDMIVSVTMMKDPNLKFTKIKLPLPRVIQKHSAMLLSLISCNEDLQS